MCMNRICKSALGAVLIAGGLGVQADEVVYDNLATPLGNYLGGFPYAEVADEVELTGAGLFTRASVAYAGFDFDGDETLTLNLYSMDGAPTPGSFGENTPGTLLFSQTLPISASNGSIVDFIDTTPDVLISGFIGVGLVFGGVDFDPLGNDAGPLLFHPPTSGDSDDDYWLRGFPNSGDPWGLYTFGGNPPINLGVQLAVVPEPGTWVAMLGFCTVAGSMVFRRYRGSR